MAWRNMPRPWSVGPTMAGRLLLISGSLRARSTNTAVLLTAQGLEGRGSETVLYRGLGQLSHYNPDLDVEPLEANAADLRAEIHRADGILFSVPEYAGALPGSVKNLLDWTIGDDKPGSIYGKPVAWINASPEELTGLMTSFDGCSATPTLRLSPKRAPTFRSPRP